MLKKDRAKLSEEVKKDKKKSNQIQVPDREFQSYLQKEVTTKYLRDIQLKSQE